jgi:hypothetical protein
LSRDDVFTFEMSALDDRRDRELDRILAGREPAEGEHEELYLLVKELQLAYVEEPLPSEVEKAHLAAMMQTARLVDEERTLTLSPAGRDDRPAGRASGTPSPRRRPVLEQLFASLSVKMAATALAGFATFGGAAAAGALPDAVQATAANVAAQVGVEIPRGGGAPEAPPIPDFVDLPDQAQVPASLPAAGHSGIPDHVQLPDQAKVPTSVPAKPDNTPRSAPPAAKPVPVPDKAPLPPQSRVPAQVPVTTPPVTVPAQVPVTTPPVTVPPQVPVTTPPVTVPPQVPVTTPPVAPSVTTPPAQPPTPQVTLPEAAERPEAAGGKGR